MFGILSLHCLSHLWLILLCGLIKAAACQRKKKHTETSSECSCFVYTMHTWCCHTELALHAKCLCIQIPFTRRTLHAWCQHTLHDWPQNEEIRDVTNQCCSQSCYFSQQRRSRVHRASRGSGVDPWTFWNYRALEIPFSSFSSGLSRYINT